MAKKKSAANKLAETLSAPALDYIAEDLRPLAVPIADLVADPRNARTHDDANLRAIVASLTRFGQRKPIVVNVTASGMLVEAGNGLVAAAQRLKWTHVAAVKVVDDAATQTGYAVADNRTAELADWNDAVLAELVAEMATDATQTDLLGDLLLADLLAAEEHASGGGDEPDDETIRTVFITYGEQDEPDLCRFLGVAQLPQKRLGKKLLAAIKARVAEASP